MNTPAHLAASLLVWRNQPGRGAALAVTAGAFLPDAPMFVFYGIQKLAGSPERDIWGTLYFDADWQLFFDVFNSIPILLAIAAVGYYLGWRWLWLLAGSAVLHCLCDLPLHHDDAHRHFLPLTHWKFESPVSYWDPKHYGHILMWVEALFAVGSCILVVYRSDQRPMRFTAWFVLGLYAIVVPLVCIWWLSTQM